MGSGSAWKRWLGDGVEVVAEPSWFSQEAEDNQGWKGDDDADVTTWAVQVTVPIVTRRQGV